MDSDRLKSLFNSGTVYKFFSERLEAPQGKKKHLLLYWWFFKRCRRNYIVQANFYGGGEINAC